jgi:peptidoglycan/xylan/chitin deacetylase (PgdA/CDA1 family)
VTGVQTCALPISDFSKDEFQKQIQDINDLGYKFVSMDDIIKNKITGKKNVLITVDDGNKSILNVYNSVMVHYDIKPVLFIYPAFIGRMTYALTFPQLKEMMAQGTTIGAHGYNHLYVNQNLYNSDIEAFKREIYRSKSSLENNLGVKINVYAYPYGSYSPITMQHVRNAGFDYAFTLIQQPLLVPLSQNPNPYELPRYMVTRSSWNAIYNILKNNELE